MATPWFLFLQALEGRFGDHSLGDPMTALLSLKQTGSFSDYRDRFELLLGRVILSETYAISLFINGLRPCVQKAVRLFTPQTLVHTYALARLQELSSSTREGFSQSSSSKQVTNGDASSSSKRVTTVDTRNLGGSNVNNSPLLPTPIMPTIKSLTPEEMGCDEKLKQLYRLELEEDVVEGEISECGEATARASTECGKATKEDAECGEASGAVCEQQLPELQTDGAGGELNLVMEGTESLNDHHERELGKEEVDVAALGGVENESVERMTVDSYAETAARSDDVAEEMGNFLVNDSESGEGEKLTKVEEEEKGDAEAVAEIPAAAVETDGSVHLAKVSEQEQVHESNEGLEDVSGQERNEHAEDKAVVAAEESQISETKMVDDENFSLKVSTDANLDVHLNESKYKEDTDLPARDIKQEVESRVGSEMTRNAEVDHLAKDAEIDADMETNSFDSKTPDDDGKMETEDTMSDVDETAQDMYDSPDGLRDEEDETIAAEVETGMQDTEMETETDLFPLLKATWTSDPKLVSLIMELQQNTPKRSKLRIKGRLVVGKRSGSVVSLENEVGEMANSYAYVGWIDDSGKGRMSTHFIDGNDASSVHPTKEKLTYVRCKSENGIITLEFTRPLNPSCDRKARHECNNIIDPSTPLKVIWAMGAQWSDDHLSVRNMHFITSKRPISVLLMHGSAEAREKQGRTCDLS